MLKEEDKTFEATATFCVNKKTNYKHAKIVLPRLFWEKNKITDGDVLVLELKGIKRLKVVEEIQ